MKTDENHGNLNKLSSPQNESLPTTKEVLIEHVHAKMCKEAPDLADKVTGMLTECSVQSLTSLLADDQLMKKKIKEAVIALKSSGQQMNSSPPLPEEKQHLGDLLFEKVAEVESELCAQITGMLLEMDESKIQKLLDDPSYLESCVTTARIRYLQEHHPCSLPTKDELGEEIYETVSASYPEECAKITGMLLELSLDELQRLVENPDLLKIRVEQAYKAIQNSAQT